jgi:16S rRNA (cytidine1402-2'-O)-methyltransferase
VEGDVTEDAGAAGGILYVVSTPIGNMGDFSFRAVETLKSVAAVLAEDTRHTRHLLDRYGIETPLLAYHEHNEAKTTPALVERLGRGESLALVSDAGTPLLSDPGARLVRAATESGVRVSPVPGASALLAALVASGLAADRLTFLGFLARTGPVRRVGIALAFAWPVSVVLYEAANRVADTLAELAESGAGERETVVARELTKQYEELRRGTPAQLAAYYAQSPPRGEVVIVIAGRTPTVVSEELLRARASALRAEGRSARDVAAARSAELGAPRNVAYRIATE